MQRKINILSTLLLIALAFGVISFSTDGKSAESFKEGAEADYYDYNGEESVAFQKGVEAGTAAKEKLPFFRFNFIVNLVPDKYTECPQTIMNAATGQEMRMSLRTVKVTLPENDFKFEWLGIVLAIISIIASILFIWLLLSFISNIKKGEIFVKKNEKKLVWMAVIAIYWFAAAWATEIAYYPFIKNAVAIDGYRVAMEHPSVAPLILGITFLLFAAIFSLGRNMKEDQEYMV